MLKRELKFKVRVMKEAKVFVTTRDCVNIDMTARKNRELNKTEEGYASQRD